MSLDLFLTRYADGGEVVLDPAAVRAVLEPLVVDRDPAHLFVGLALGPDPEEDTVQVFGYGEPFESLMLEIDGGDEVRAVVLELARRTGAAIAPAEGPVAVTDEAALAHLPAELRSGAVVVSTVEELTAFLTAQR